MGPGFEQRWSHRSNTSPNALRSSSHSKILLFSFAVCTVGWTAGCTVRCNAGTTDWSSGCTAGGDELGDSIEALSSSLRPLFFSQLLPDVLFATSCTEVACSLLCTTVQLAVRIFEIFHWGEIRQPVVAEGLTNLSTRELL